MTVREFVNKTDSEQIVRIDFEFESYCIGKAKNLVLDFYGEWFVESVKHDTDKDIIKVKAVEELEA